MIIENFKWKNGFEKWNTFMVHTPRDMHCFFHCILLSLSDNYRNGVFNGKKVKKEELASKLRKELANELSKNNYNNINNGYIKDNIDILPKEFILDNMVNTLKNKSLIGQELFDFVSDQINKDIYILDWENKRYYKTLDEDIRIKNRKSIVMIYIDDCHYNLLVLKEGDCIKTYFDHDHPFIEFLKTNFK